MITIDNGPAKLQTGNFKIIHIIETEQYENIISTLETIVLKKLMAHPLHPILSSLLNQSKTYLNSIKINKKLQKRSLDFIGTAWKWIAGNPDHSDYEILTNKMNNVLENNNQQVIINKLMNNKINELINITNKLTKAIEEDKKMEYDLVLTIKFKLEIIKEELINTAYAIHWAKANIVNSFILSDKEMNITKKIIENENIPFFNIDEALEFAEVKLAANENCLIYIISLPTTGTEECRSTEIRPIKKNEVINKIMFKLILLCPNKVYGIYTNCKSYNSISICPKNAVKDISDDACITHLLNSKTENCTKINNEHIKSVEEISSDLIFLNQFNDVIKINNESLMVNGTYLIKYHNASLEIDGILYNSNMITGKKPLPAILQPLSKYNNLEEILSLESIKKFQTNETIHLNLLKKQNNVFFSINILSMFVILILIILMFKKMRIKNNSNVTETNTNEIGIQNLSRFFVRASNEDVRI